MPNTVISFPKWEEVLSGLIEQYRLKIDLPESFFEEAYVAIKKTGASKTRTMAEMARQERPQLGFLKRS